MDGYSRHVFGRVGVAGLTGSCPLAVPPELPTCATQRVCCSVCCNRRPVECVTGLSGQVDRSKRYGEIDLPYPSPGVLQKTLLCRQHHPTASVRAGELCETFAGVASQARASLRACHALSTPRAAVSFGATN
jgi:hypothetical protein